MPQEGDRRYFYVEAKKVDDRGATGFEQTIFTRKIGEVERYEAIWLHVYRALRPGIGDQLIITCMQEVDEPETADTVTQ